MASKKITQEQLKKLVHYDPTTGIFTRRINNRKIGTTMSIGYVSFSVNKQLDYAHRLAFLYMTGEIPEVVDHVNKIKDDNRWINLRAANKSTNSANSKLFKTNTSGYKGVRYDGNRNLKKPFRAILSRRENGKRKNKHLGYYSTALEAHSAYVAAAKSKYGEFFT